MSAPSRRPVASLLSIAVLLLGRLRRPRGRAGPAPLGDPCRGWRARAARCSRARASTSSASTILGVLENALGPRQSIILARLDGGPLAADRRHRGDERQPGLRRRASSSARWPTPSRSARSRSPGITPIGEMIEATQTSAPRAASTRFHASARGRACAPPSTASRSRPRCSGRCARPWPRRLRGACRPRSPGPRSTRSPCPSSSPDSTARPSTGRAASSPRWASRRMLGGGRRHRARSGRCPTCARRGRSASRSSRATSTSR